MNYSTRSKAIRVSPLHAVHEYELNETDSEWSFALLLSKVRVLSVYPRIPGTQHV